MMDNFNNSSINNDFNRDDREIFNKNNIITTDYVEVNQSNRKKGPRRKKALSYVVVGLICSMVGGAASTAASLYLLPKSDLFKSTPLYQSMVENKTESTYLKPSPMSTNSGALSVSEIAKKVGPAVVGVSTKSQSDPDYFGFSQSQEGLGSGIIINEEGYILTNYHVIEGANKVSIIFNNKKEVQAKIINYDADLDLAIVKVTENVKMPAVAELGNSKDMQVGDPVVAIGNPLGKELLGSVTTGVISAANREIKVGNVTQTLIQTDAAINPGNSGGALVNSYGQVIGVNSAKMGGDGVEGLGFSIPIDIVKPKISTLLKPILKIGIAGRDITSDMAKRYNMPEGVYVAQVEEFSPAEKSGLKTGDIILKFDGKSVKSINDINKIKGEHKSGDQIQIDVYRDGKNKLLTLTLSE
ncbi:trypsin-like peptidase domain-containing protein [Clostridium sp. A1-XYC3]|uniref:Trypsin-like peptidase domain-containing protein n=2 Tax=Clostridium tanneri TaxID=3037988 RepID=A0ABU4JPA7_9CLOT|nr:trypsin-like peptidase domain-containing protein [Clostridium sp. A1-XYC3]MDW8799791.1 trypsin-like peptidase domain-containing protein [Clostridium sp. A1-XYC3]